MSFTAAISLLDTPDTSIARAISCIVLPNVISPFRIFEVKRRQNLILDMISGWPIKSCMSTL
jgi:hypothetical protein